jgi:uncharacterized protein YegL
MIYQSGITQTKDLFTAIFLLDVSGSMAGPKIQKLNQCMEDIVNELKILSKESSIQVSVITFGNRVDIHTPLTNVLDLNWQPLIASGGTPMGAAISKAKLLIVDSNLMKITIFKPIIILISDGQPTDDWKNPLQDFIAQDKLTLCDRHALAIGEAASQAAALQMFAHPNQVFEAQDAKNIPQFFKHVQNTITQSISVSLSQQGAI